MSTDTAQIGKENNIVLNFGRILLGVSARRSDISYVKK